MPGDKYEYGIDFGAVDAIDVHTHVEIDSSGHGAYDPELAEATGRHFNLDPGHAATVDDLAEHYRRHNTAAVVFTIDAQTASGHRPNSVEELTGDFGVKGFKFHPSLQGFEPNDRRFYPIYQAIAAAGVPALFHTGQTGLGSALPGGYGIKLRYSDPMLLDDVAADFPELTIVMAHPAVPWVDAQIAIASHKANCYIDLSGWSPKYFPPQLIRALGRQLRSKALFGTDHPYITLERWRRDFDALDIDPSVLPMILKRNALEVLGIPQA